jgi:polyisoprenyl-phosphate glycosyltransferase
MISVIIPLFNEEQLVENLLSELQENLKHTKEIFEIVCIDDGSTDTTLQKLIRLHEHHKEVKIISLSRNFGLQAALTAGINFVKGDYIVIMDGDFQDPPELVPVLYEKMRATGADIVSAVREDRSEKLVKKLYINIFHRIFDNLTGGQQVSQTGNFCIINKKAHHAMMQFTERNRYIPGIRNFIGFRHEFILYDRPDRRSGEAKMDYRKLFMLAANAIYSFSKWPIIVCLYLGLFGVLIFLGAIIYTFASKFLGLAPIGWSSMFLTISFFGSVQLTFLGLIGEYVYRIFKEVQNRPIYFIQNIYDE